MVETADWNERRGIAETSSLQLLKNLPSPSGLECPLAKRGHHEEDRCPAKQSAAFSGSGQKLGGESSGRPLGGGSGPAMPAIPNVAEMLTAPGQFAQGRGIPAMIVRFLGLYISTLFSFDPMKTAEESPFAVKKANFNKAR